MLNFKRPSGTSRGILKSKETWFIVILKGHQKGIGECGILRSLSYDDRPDYEQKLQWVCKNIHLGKEELWLALQEYPSIRFGLEMAFLSLEQPDPMVLFPSNFTEGRAGIEINGLIWMGDKDFMNTQVREKLDQGFTCIKLKIGAIDFNQELDILTSIRSEFSKSQIELRVDANGAFDPADALNKLDVLSIFDLHSIEQPIRQGQWDKMKYLCKNSPFPVALDEELIGIFDMETKKKLLEFIRPDYIILKPSLLGGFQATQEWIALAELYGIGWWITSALESNVGLNAIAQFTYTLQNQLPQGLGTGNLYTNNVDSPLFVQHGILRSDPKKEWNLTYLN